MIFSRKNAGKWVASKDGKVIATGKNLDSLCKKIDKRKDRAAIGYDLVPKYPYFIGGYGISVR